MADLCPPGFEKKDGDIDGWGSRLGSKLHLSLEDCAEKCNQNDGCLSFEHSISERKCNLNDIRGPIVEPYKDYVFCSKKGNLYYFHQLVLENLNK